jgi:hypothetical protein
MKYHDYLNHTKSVACGAIALCVALTAVAEPPPQQHQPPRLTGIVSLAPGPYAVLDLAGLGPHSPDWLILSAGQQEEGIEVRSIASDAGSVELFVMGAGTNTVRLANATKLPVPGIVLEDASLNAVLWLFGAFTNRTLLRWPMLPQTSFRLREPARDRLGAARVLAQALAAKELAIIPDGEQFLMIVPKSKAASVKPHAPPFKPSSDAAAKPQPAPISTSSEDQGPLPEGMIDFRGADVIQVADIASMLMGRQLDRNHHLPSMGAIYIATQSQLSLKQGIYAMETLLLWSGVKLVPIGTNEMKAVVVERN